MVEDGAIGAEFVSVGAGFAGALSGVEELGGGTGPIMRLVSGVLGLTAGANGGAGKALEDGVGDAAGAESGFAAAEGWVVLSV